MNIGPVTIYPLRCAMHGAINIRTKRLGYLHHPVPEGEENGDPWDDNCTANWASGRGMNKSQAVQSLCDELKRTSDSQWAE